MCSWRAMPQFFTLISMRATRRSSSETIRSSAREECDHAGAPPRPAHVHALSADAPRRGLTRRDCGRLRLNQTRRPRLARTDRVERPRDSPIRAERRVPITRRTRRFACPSRAVPGACNFREHRRRGARIIEPSNTQEPFGRGPSSAAIPRVRRLDRMAHVLSSGAAPTRTS